MHRVKDWVLLEPSVADRLGLRRSKWLSVVQVPVDRAVNGKTFSNVEPLYKIVNCVRCAYCCEDIRLNVPNSVVGTNEASSANVSFDNVKVHFEFAHKKHPLVAGT